ncbi:MAG: polyphosphate kinase 2 family protein, partial [Actinobacteria bacterium]|nr:polyphosphate kinase 2 family protein [Actinomycetota bacterium]
MAIRKKTRTDKPSDAIPPRVSDLLRVPVSLVDLADIATGATPGFTGSDKADGKAAMRRLAPRLADLQEQLYAEGHPEGDAAGRRSLLLVLQGMDTAGKGGTVEHVLSLMNP